LDGYKNDEMDDLSTRGEFIETRWTKIKDSWPLPGMVFVGRNNGQLYPKLFVRLNRDTVYLRDTSTHLPCLSDFMTHWLLVAIVQIAQIDDK
jgi:hypothetical protein